MVAELQSAASTAEPHPPNYLLLIAAAGGVPIHEGAFLAVPIATQDSADVGGLSEVCCGSMQAR